MVTRTLPATIDDDDDDDDDDEAESFKILERGSDCDD